MYFLYKEEIKTTTTTDIEYTTVLFLYMLCQRSKTKWSLTKAHSFQ